MDAGGEIEAEAARDILKRETTSHCARWSIETTNDFFRTDRAKLTVVARECQCGGFAQFVDSFVPGPVAQARGLTDG